MAEDATRTVAFILPMFVMACVTALFAAAAKHRRTRAFFYADASARPDSGDSSGVPIGGYEQHMDLSSLVPELLGDRIGKRIDMLSEFDYVNATFGASMDEVRVVACGAETQVNEARAQCERLNKAIAAGGSLWRFEEECWDW